MRTAVRRSRPKRSGDKGRKEFGRPRAIPFYRHCKMLEACNAQPAELRRCDIHIGEYARRFTSGKCNAASRFYSGVMREAKGGDTVRFPNLLQLLLGAWGAMYLLPQNLVRQGPPPPPSAISVVED